MPENSSFDDRDFVPPGDEELIPSATSDSPAVSGEENGKKWIIPVLALGCGCICLPLVMIVVGVLGLGNTARRLYQSTGTYQVYQLATQAVETDPAAIAALGGSVETGWTSRSTEVYGTNNIGKVCIRFNVIGADRSGSAYAEAENSEGSWQLHQLKLSVNGEVEPLTIVPLAATEQSLCPDFDTSEPDLEGTDPDRDEPPSLPGTEI